MPSSSSFQYTGVAHTSELLFNNFVYSNTGNTMQSFNILEERAAFTCMLDMEETASLAHNQNYRTHKWKKMDQANVHRKDTELATHG
jgi:hypothetical protein